MSRYALPRVPPDGPALPAVALSTEVMNLL
jgi:hypothetical protein